LSLHNTSVNSEVKNYACREGVDIAVAFSAGAPVESTSSSDVRGATISEKAIADVPKQRPIGGVSRVVKKYACREGVDIAVAFSAGAPVESVSSSDVRAAAIGEKAVADALKQTPIAGVSPVKCRGTPARFKKNVVRRLLKAALRAPVKLLYRLLKPLVRPIAFRLRAYFLNAVREEFADMREHMTYSRAEVVDLLRNMRQEAGQLQQAAQADRISLAHALTLELRSTGNSLQQDILARLLPEFGILQEVTQKLGVCMEALESAIAAPVRSPQLDRLEQLALEEAKTMAESELALARKFDYIEQLVLDEARVRAETVPEQSLKLDRIEQLALVEAKLRAETLPVLSVKLDRVEQLVLDEARVRAETVPEQSLKLDRIEQLGLVEAKLRAETLPVLSVKLDRIEQLAIGEAKVRGEMLPEQSLKLDRIEGLALEEAKARAEAAPAQSFKLDRIEQLALEEAKARAENGPAQALKLGRIEQYALASARRFAINCGGEQVMVRTEVGFLICSGADQALLAILVESGELEPGTRRVIQRILKPGDVFIDVGANVGLHTLAAARAMEGRGKIIAFEPFGETARLLEASVWLNGFSSMTEIHRAAVSTATGTHSLYLGNTSGHHSLFPLHAETSLTSRTVEVPLMRIDDVVDKSQPVTLIKIDVEGAELEVLETARQTILRNPDIAIVAEFGPSHLLRTGHKSSEWIGAFTSLGLDYRAINEKTGALEIWSIDQLDDVSSINLLFARAGSSALLQ
jgi:FkbM family methyltransferase